MFDVLIRGGLRASSNSLSEGQSPPGSYLAKPAVFPDGGRETTISLWKILAYLKTLGGDEFFLQAVLSQCLRDKAALEFWLELSEA